MNTKIIVLKFMNDKRAFVREERTRDCWRTFYIQGSII